MPSYGVRMSIPRSGVVDAATASAARGRAVRTRVPRTDLAVVGTDRAGRDPVAEVLAQEVGRLPDLLPLRHSRMAASPLAFYRGTAGLMAADLGGTTHTGLRAQLCGDAHLSNFGVFGTPERRLVFDLNDFDETYRGPFEWDVKRLAASIELAGRALGLDADARRTACRRTAREYRRAMRAFAQSRAVDVWYASLDAADVGLENRLGLDRAAARSWRRLTSRATSRDHRQAAARLTTTTPDGERRFVADPPLLVPATSALSAQESATFHEGLEDLVAQWRASLPADRRHLAAQYRVVDVARKVVGVGSVGTRAWVLLLVGATPDDVLVLQAKEAGPSVLEPYLPPGPYEHPGRRVVEGQRLMQAASDVFLGWQDRIGLDGVPRAYYVRQLRDWKGAVDVGRIRHEALVPYGRACAWTLARAHARSGERIAIAQYLGSSPRADEAFAQFATTYADQVERDHAAFAAAVADGAVSS